MCHAFINLLFSFLKGTKISSSSTPWPAKPARRERKQKQNPRERKSKKKCEFSRKLSEKGEIFLLSLSFLIPKHFSLFSMIKLHVFMMNSILKKWVRREKVVGFI